MLKNGKIETRIFSKSEPIYLNPDSCHDSSVFKSIFTGVGLSLRLNCSKDEDFDKAVKKYSRAASGHPYRRAKFELGKAKHINHEEFLKDEKNANKQKGRKAVETFTVSINMIPAFRTITNNYQYFRSGSDC